ncbi:MAG: methylenetetrahydrofolate--tRNA-(uracil(54)-C(5))-methyltransferase (FADH(2)-oxidizing) TrmFO [Leptolinea sp.]
MKELVVVGGGLAGCEAAFQAAIRGINVKLYEMRPEKMTPAHTSGQLAEIICSNSFGSLLPDRASGLLIQELKQFGSFLIQIAEESAVPAGGSLAVDRELFSKNVSAQLQEFSNIQIIREEMPQIPDVPAIIASGPLTSGRLSESIQEFTGLEQFYFYDAIAPIIHKDSIDMSIAFQASRFGASKGQTDDYINCPLSKEEFTLFVEELISAERIQLQTMEGEIENGVKAGKGSFFEGCLPVEVIASRGQRSLTFGPMRPIGLSDPRIEQRPYAVLQLRQDNLAASLYNMVGFQTNLKFSEQERVFRMIPGLQNAEFVRFGQMHRNSFIASPAVLQATLQTINRSDLFFAGQISGVEGYLGNIGTGLLAGINAANFINDKDLLTPPSSTMLGALCRYITECPLKDFQPMKANFGILPELDHQARTRLERTAQHVQNARLAMNKYLMENEKVLRP